MKKILVVLVVLAVLCGCFVGLVACKKDQRADDVIYIRNLYFGNWSDFNDDYTKAIEEKFGVKFTDTENDVKPQSYDFSSWDQQVKNDFSGDLPDLFQANIDSYNFNTNYVRWAKAGTIKALPDEVLNTNGKWKNLAKMLNGLTDINYLKYDGKLYGIPLARNIQQSDVPFAPFTYIYRRDVAKKLGVYQDNDEYTWEQFAALLDAFKKNDFNQYGAIGDSEWGFPSILNYYKTASHAFAIENGKVVNNYATTQYLTGLEQTKNWSDYYLTKQSSYALQQNMVKEEYVASQHIGVFYENLSMSNYLAIRKKLPDDDKTAIMKVKGPDGKYALEEQEQWFSMSLFNGNISDAKMEKILDIMDWLLSEEGTMMALYGIEGQDYTKDAAGNVTVNEGSGSLWHRGRDKKYTSSASNNGARYLRYIVTLGNDLNDRDPLIQGMEDEKKAYDILKTWNDEMMAALNRNELRILGEDSRVKWMQTDSKQRHASELLSDANMSVLNYSLTRVIKTQDDYLAKMNTSEWKAVLSEINSNLK